MCITTKIFRFWKFPILNEFSSIVCIGIGYLLIQRRKKLGLLFEPAEAKFAAKYANGVNGIQTLDFSKLMKEQTFSLPGNFFCQKIFEKFEFFTIYKYFKKFDFSKNLPPSTIFSKNFKKRYFFKKYRKIYFFKNFAPPPFSIFKKNLAIEWLNETFCRSVTVNVDYISQSIRLEKPRAKGSVLRKLDLSQTNAIRVAVTKKSSRGINGPFVVISVPRNYDMVKKITFFKLKT